MVLKACLLLPLSNSCLRNEIGAFRKPDMQMHTRTFVQWGRALSLLEQTCKPTGKPRSVLDALVATLRADRQFLTALTAACAQDIASIGGRHALAETVLVAALPYGGLKSPFHLRAKLFPGEPVSKRDGKDRSCDSNSQQNMRLFHRGCLFGLKACKPNPCQPRPFSSPPRANGVISGHGKKRWQTGRGRGPQI